MKLKNIIDDLYFSLNSDGNLFGKVDRTTIIRYVKRFVQKVQSDNGNKQFVRAIQVSPQDTVIDFPEDAVEIVSLGIDVYITGKGSTILPLYINPSLNSASIFLRDNNDVILEDNEGKYLRGDSEKSTAITTISNLQGVDGCWNVYNGSSINSPSLNLKGGDISVKPQYSINVEDRFVQLSTIITDSDILILEYTYDPFSSGNVGNNSVYELDINEAYFEAVELYVMKEIARIRGNVSYTDKENLDKNYKIALRNANVQIKRIKTPMQALRRRQNSLGL